MTACNSVVSPRGALPKQRVYREPSRVLTRTARVSPRHERLFDRTESRGCGRVLPEIFAAVFARPMRGLERSSLPVAPNSFKFRRLTQYRPVNSTSHCCGLLGSFNAAMRGLSRDGWFDTAWRIVLGSPAAVAGSHRFGGVQSDSDVCSRQTRCRNRQVDWSGIVQSEWLGVDIAAWGRQAGPCDDVGNSPSAGPWTLVERAHLNHGKEDRQEEVTHPV